MRDAPGDSIRFAKTKVRGVSPFSAEKESKCSWVLVKIAAAACSSAA